MRSSSGSNERIFHWSIDLDDDETIVESINSDTKPGITAMLDQSTRDKLDENGELNRLVDLLKQCLAKKAIEALTDDSVGAPYRLLD